MEILPPVSRSVERDPSSVRTRRTGQADAGESPGLFDPDRWNGPPPDDSPHPPLWGFAKANNVLTATPRSQLGSSAKIVHTALTWMAWHVAEKAKSPGPVEFWMFIADLARRTGLSTGHVRRQIAILKSAGLVRVRKDRKCDANRFTGQWFTVLDDPSEGSTSTDARSLDAPGEPPGGCARRRADVGAPACPRPLSGAPTSARPRPQKKTSEETKEKETLNVGASPDGGEGEGREDIPATSPGPEPVESRPQLVGEDVEEQAADGTTERDFEVAIAACRDAIGAQRRNSKLTDGLISDLERLGKGDPEPLSRYRGRDVPTFAPAPSPLIPPRPSPGGPRPAPRAPDREESEIHALIDQFSGEQGERATGDWVRRLMRVWPQKDELKSLAWYESVAREAREGRNGTTLEMLHEATEAAYGPKVVDRAACFSAVFLSKKSQGPKWRAIITPRGGESPAV